jgi:hypothetical protein
MIRFPKRARSKSIDLEDGDVVELGSSSSDGDPEDLVDTGVVPPKAKAPLARAKAPGTLAPMAMAARSPEDTFLIPRLERRPPSRVRALLELAGDRPSLPWAAALLALGAIGAAGSMRLLDALDGRAHDATSAAAAAQPPPAPSPLTFAAPLAAPAKPAAAPPVVLKFGAADALTVAVDAPKPADAPPKPAPAAAPATTAAAAPASPAPIVVTAAKKPAPVAAPTPAPAPAAPADTVKRAATVDSLAEQQLKAALK